MSKKIDKFIEEALKNNIEITQSDKTDVWNKIEKEAFEKKSTFKKNTKFQLRYFLSTAATATIMVFGAQTEPGSALVDKVKLMFVPEKTVQIAMEGSQEPTTMTLRRANDMSAMSMATPEVASIDDAQPNIAEYVIYIDEDRYVMNNSNGLTVITPKLPMDAKYPEVSMEISQVENVNPDDAVANLQVDLNNEFEDVTKPENVVSPFEAITLGGKAGNEWNSPIVKHYVFSNGKSGSFVITQRYFLEASEGHAVRFDAMLKEFSVVK